MIFLTSERDSDLISEFKEHIRGLRDLSAGLIEKSDVSEFEQGGFLVLPSWSLGVLARSHTEE